MIEADVARAGMSVLGGLQAGEQDVPGVPEGTATLVLIGWAGPTQWRYFAESAEYTDGHPDPLDRWTGRIVDDLANRLGARPLYPFGGPPWLPFQTWALAAGIGYKSPIGLLIHPQFGLWHSYRAALAFARPVDLPAGDRLASPCDTCIERPCLTTCPVDAFTASGFAVQSCRTHIKTVGVACRDGCLARAACPAGSDYRSSPEQIAFHQRAFLTGIS